MRIIRELKDYPPLFEIFGLVREREDAVFLDSSLQNEMGRFSIVGLNPYLKLEKGEAFTVNGTPCGESFEDYVRGYLKRNREENPTKLPLVDGALGYFSYDYGREKEGLPTRHPSQISMPLCRLCFYDAFLIEDHREKSLSLIANGKKQDARKTMGELLELVERARQAAQANGPGPTGEQERKKAPFQADFTGTAYRKAVQNMIDYIIEGDIYIVNMTQQLHIPTQAEPYEVFLRLRRDNPSPFGGYFNCQGFQIVCASPERFLRIRDGQVETRPIKGTRKRGQTPEEDEQLRKELLHSGKDQSELLMIVDLERNDLNRVCRPGSVRVSELFTVEAYATVFHLVANIEGELADGMTPMDVIEAAFPGGSITGAPKRRAMELIDQQERGRRNLYTGSLGYLSLDGNCDFNIVIRTALFQEGVCHLGVGGGITFESDLAFEYEEILQKAKAILEALYEEKLYSV